MTRLRLFIVVSVLLVLTGAAFLSLEQIEAWLGLDEPLTTQPIAQPTDVNPSPESDKVVLNDHADPAMAVPAANATKAARPAQRPISAPSKPVAQTASGSETAPAPAPAASAASVPASASVTKPSIAPAAVVAAAAPMASPVASPAKPASAVTPVTAPSLPATPVAVVPAKPSPAVEKPKEVQLTIRDIKFTGVTLFPEKELTTVVSEFIGKELTVQEAFAIPAKIANHYKKHNHMAIATLVEGMSPDGTLKVGVVEMQMTQTQAEKELATLAKPTPEAKPIAAAMSNVEKVEIKDKTGLPPTTALSTAPAAPAASATSATSAPPTASPASAPAASIAPTAVAAATAASASVAASPARMPSSKGVSALEYAANGGKVSQARGAEKNVDSETDYILKQYANKSRQYELMVDNHGHESTGKTRVGAGFVWGGDQLSLLAVKSQGSDYLRMALRWATGVDGLKVGVNASNMNYEVNNNLQTALYKSGDAVKRGFEVLYDIVNEPGQLSTAAFKYDTKSVNTTGVNSADSAAFQSWVPSFELKGLFKEMMPGGAVFGYNTTFSQGRVDIAGSHTMGGIEVDEGLFAKIRFNGTALQPMGGWGSIFASFSLQRSNKNLDPSERFYLGGPLGVRAYGVGEGYGSEGELATLEFRQRLSANTTLSEFYDWGRARLLHNQSLANDESILGGYGLSVSQDLGYGVTLKGTWARNDGRSPLPNFPQDNEHKVDRNRFWLSLESRF